VKTIDTLISDMYEVIEGKGGWDEAITQFLSHEISSIAEDRFSAEQKPRDRLSLSMLGTPCKTKIWNMVNDRASEEPLSAEALGTFFYGDLLEAFIISLAKAAGHTVEGLQGEVNVFGIPGHGDCIIDGWRVDVKSASNFGFEKFKKNSLKEDDPFGYISQLSSYLHADQDDPRVTEKNKAAFLVVKKERFKLCLDIYDLRKELDLKEGEVNRAKEVVQGDEPDYRVPPVAEGKSGNEVLSVMCNYCGWRKKCWPNVRTFIYSTGPKHFTKIVREPRVMEVTE